MEKYDIDFGEAKTLGGDDNFVRIMTIHKSKGLEFPIVFLANCSKKPNMMDASKNILLHSKMGLGPEYIDYQRKIKYPT